MTLCPCPINHPAIATLLHLICPPSALAPLPPHLLSLPLLQRHHFLGITTDDQAAYLTWPGADPQPVLALLELIRPEDHPSELVQEDIRYSADPEAIHAHIRITPTLLPSSHSSHSSLRLVFLWDQPSASWKYHNSVISDFPENSHPDLSHAMSLFQSSDDFLPERTYSFTADNLEDRDDDDAYWDAYGTTDQSLHSRPSKSILAASTDSEDAYWAQYSSIQGQSPSQKPASPPSNFQHSPGSADSTIPSPRPPHPSLQPTQADERIFVPSADLNPDLSQSEVYNPLAPPTPGALARRLASLPTRPGSPPFNEPDDDPSSASPSSSPQSTHPDFGEVEEPFVLLPQVSSNLVTGQPNVTPLTQSTSPDEALKSTIRGLFLLWQSHERSQQDFMALVQQAIQEQSISPA